MTDTKTAIITGASSGNRKPSWPDVADADVHLFHSGIGKASAIALSEAGWNVVLIARRVNELRETQQSCQREGQGSLILPGDVADEEFVIKSFQQAFSTFGELTKCSRWLCASGSEFINHKNLFL